MVKREFFKTREDGVSLYRSYSDNGMMIRKVGTDEVYDEAIDIENSGFEYEETDVPINGEIVIDTDKATEKDLLNAHAELGVTDEEDNA